MFIIAYPGWRNIRQKTCICLHGYVSPLFSPVRFERRNQVFLVLTTNFWHMIRRVGIHIMQNTMATQAGVCFFLTRRRVACQHMS